MVGEVAIIAVFFLVMGITLLIFCGWAFFMVVRGIVGGVAGLFGPPRSRAGPRMASTNTVRCMNRGCGAVNPTNARFCRRCGHMMPAAQRVQVRRAAVW